MPLGVELLVPNRGARNLPVTLTPTDRTIECNGLSLHFVEWGDPNNPTVLIHHGFLDYFH